MTGGDDRRLDGLDEIELLARRARAVAAPLADDIRSREINQINTLIDDAVTKARQLVGLLQSLAEQLECRDAEP